MVSPLIITIFLALLSAIVVYRLSEPRKLADPERTQITSTFPLLGLITVGAFIILSFLFSLSVALGFVCGVVIYVAAEYVRLIMSEGENTSSLYGLFAAAFSVLIISAARLMTPDVLPLITLLIGAVVAAWILKSNYSTSLTIHTLLITVTGVLGATYFYAGSERAAIFPIVILAAGCAATLISIFIATRYSWKKPLQMFTSASISFFILCALTSIWIIPFKPHFVVACIAVGLACAYACMRVRTLWIRFALLLATILFGYWLAEFYGILIAFISFSALIGNIELLPASSEHTKISNSILLIVLFLLFIRSIPSAGRSILFELGDPFVWVGILCSALLLWGYTAHAARISTTARHLWLLLSPIVFSLFCVLIFGKIHGTVVITGALFGLIFQTIMPPNEKGTVLSHHPLLILFILQVFLFINALFS